MKIQLIPSDVSYHGIGIHFSTDLLRTKKGLSNLPFLLREYFSYFEYVKRAEDPQIFERVLNFYRLLDEHDVLCRLIAYDEKPIEDLHGQRLEFLGIDIADLNGQSMLYNEQTGVETLYTDTGLFKTEAEATRAIEINESEGAQWKLYYVYGILLD